MYKKDGYYYLLVADGDTFQSPYDLRCAVALYMGPL
jgi:beta-xylosidase